MTDIDDLIESLAADAAGATPSPHPFATGMKWMGGTALYLAALLAISGFRTDLSHALNQPLYLAELALLLLLYLSCALSAALFAYPDLHQKHGLAHLPAAVFALFAVLMFFSWNRSPQAPLPVHSWQCTLSIALVAVPPAAWMFHLLRRHASTHPGMAGIVAVLSAFSVGSIWLRLHEVNDSIRHVMIWHYLPMLAAAIFGLWLGRKLLKW